MNYFNTLSLHPSHLNQAMRKTLENIHRMTLTSL